VQQLLVQLSVQCLLCLFKEIVMYAVNNAYKYMVSIKPLNEWTLHEFNATLRAYADAWEASTPKKVTQKHFTKVYLKV
jgi:hypothetical protein